VQLPGPFEIGAVVVGRSHVLRADGRGIDVIDPGSEPPTLRRIEHGLLSGGARSVALSGDEQTVYVAGNEGPVTALSSVVRAYDTATGAQRPWQIRPGPGSIGAIALTPDGATLVASSLVSNTITTWDVATGARLGGDEPWRTSSYELNVSPDGRFVLTATSQPVTFSVWEIATRGRVLGPIPLHPGSIGGDGAFSADGTKLAVLSQEGEAQVWDIPSGRQLGATIDAQGGGGRGVGFTNGDASLVLGSAVPAVYALDGSVSYGRALPAAVGQSASWSPDGTRLVVSGTDQTVTVLDAGTLQPLTPAVQGPPLRGGGPQVPPRASFSPDGTVLAVAFAGTRLELFDGRTGASLGPPLLEDPATVGTAATDIGWSADGRRLAVSGFGGVWVFDVADRRALVDRLRLADVVLPFQLALSPDGSLLYATVLGGQSVAVVDVDRGERLPEITLPGQSPGYLDLDSTGSRLVVGSTEGMLRVLAVPGGKVLQEIRTHTEQVPGASWSHDDRLLLSHATATTAKLVDVATGQVYEPGFPVPGLSAGMDPFSPDDRVAVGRRAEGGLYLIDLDPDVWKRKACELAGRNLTATEWARYLPNGGAHRATCAQWPLLEA
jgi:WD40 repeat protein